MSMLDVPTLYRLIFEIRFKPTLAYYDGMVEMASSLEGYFDTWETSVNPYQVTMFSKEKHESMRAAHGTLSRTFERVTTPEEFKTAITDLSTLFLLSTDISQIDRIGVRSTGLYKVNGSSEKLVNNFHETFYARPELSRDISGDSIEDVAVFIDGIKNGFKNKVRFGPMTDEQVGIQFGTLLTREAKTPSKANISLDIDIFIDNNIAMDGIEKKYSKIVDENIRQHEEWQGTIGQLLK